MDERAILKRIATHPPEVQAAALRGAIADRYRGSLISTSRDLLGYGDINRYTHGDLIDALCAANPNKLIVMPRGTFKSTISVVAYSIWRLIRDPNERILIDSEVYANSKNFLREIKGHLELPKLTSLFGEFKSQTNWNEGEITINQRSKVFKEASITCGGIETVKVGQHYSIIIEDDLNSGNNSETQEGRKKVIRHHQMNTAILDPGGTLVVVGTRYSTDDVIGFILENEIKGAA